MVLIGILSLKRLRRLGASHPEADTEKLAAPEEAERERSALSPFTTLCLWSATLLLSALVVFGFACAYANYGPPRYRYRCQFQMRADDDFLPLPQQFWSDADEADPNTFREEFDVSADYNRATIDVPEFRTGRRSQFVHDFGVNLTAIVDSDYRRCLVMKLDRNAVLPPQSLVDLVQRLMNGEYNVDVNLVKRSMVVVLPPVEDISEFGVPIVQNCAKFVTYRLEKSPRALAKRSADAASASAKYIEFAGKDMQEFDIVNLDDALKYEEKMRSDLN